MNRSIGLSAALLSIVALTAGATNATALRQQSTEPPETAAPSDSAPSESTTPASAASTTAEAAPIVGSWHRAQTCEEMLAAFEEAGLAESHRDWLQGNFFGGRPGPTEGDLCAGARGALEHSHFFTESGEFGSHDENGQQVDDGPYEVVDADTLLFPTDEEDWYDITVDFEITGDVVTFDVLLPDPCEDACTETYAWALSAFASGPWTRGEVPALESTTPASTESTTAGSDTTTDPSPEPGAGRIMFQRAPGGEVVDTEETDVWVMSADGNDEQLLATAAQPGRWSPDGSEVSIFCCDDPEAIAHVVDVATGDVRVLATPDPTLELHCEYGWSPNGERLVCEGYGLDDPSRNGIYSVRASDGGDLTQITSNPAGGDIPGTYSPDGTQLVFKRFEGEVITGMFIVDISDDGTASGEPRQFTPAGMVLDDTGHGGRWSPDGDEILFVGRDSEDHHKAIWVYDVAAADGAPHQLSIAPGCGGPLGETDAYGCYAPDWSPDVDLIVFTRSEPDGSNESIWTVNTDGSGLVQLTDGTDDNSAWGPPPPTT